MFINVAVAIGKALGIASLKTTFNFTTLRFISEKIGKNTLFFTAELAMSNI